MAVKHYTRGRATTPDRLISKLIKIGDASITRARRIFADLLAARVGKLVELGVTLEMQYALGAATDEEIVTWQQEIHQRLVADVQLRKANPFVGQGIRLEQAQIFPSADGLSVEVTSNDLGELLAMQAYILARVVGRERLRQCQCGQLFVRTGRREYCSERCQKRFYMRRFRAGEGGEG